MTVIADITVPADAFELGRVLQDFPEVVIELERIVPLQETIIPLFWTSGTDCADIEAALGRSPQTKSVTQLTTTNEKTLFEVHWSSEINGIVAALVETRAKILEATGKAETWDFRLRFGTHEQLSEFNMALTNQNIPRHAASSLQSVSAGGDRNALGRTVRGARDGLSTRLFRGSEAHHPR